MNQEEPVPYSVYDHNSTKLSYLQSQVVISYLDWDPDQSSSQSVSMVNFGGLFVLA